MPLAVVALDQRRIGPPSDDKRKLPTEIVSIGDPRVTAACAKRRHLMCRVTEKDDPANNKTIGEPALVAPDPSPHDFVRRVFAKRAPQTPADFLHRARALD